MTLSNPPGRTAADPVELVAAHIRLVAEAIAVVFTIGVAIILTGIWSGAI